MSGDNVHEAIMVHVQELEPRNGGCWTWKQVLGKAPPRRVLINDKDRYGPHRNEVNVSVIVHVRSGQIVRLFLLAGHKLRIAELRTRRNREKSEGRCKDS